MSSNRAVFKYPLPLSNQPGDALPLMLPFGAKILKVAGQQEDPVRGPKFMVWALIDPKETFHDLRHVITAGTGHTIPTDALAARTWEYTDSILAMGGQFVLHVWISASEGKRSTEVSAGNT